MYDHRPGEKRKRTTPLRNWPRGEARSSAQAAGAHRIGPVRAADAQDLLVGDGGEQVGDRDLHPQVRAVAPRQQDRIELRHRLEREAALVEARVRHDQVDLRVGDALSIDGQDVEVDKPRAPSAAIRIPPQRQLQALELAQEVGGLRSVSSSRAALRKCGWPTPPRGALSYSEETRTTWPIPRSSATAARKATAGSPRFPPRPMKARTWAAL